MIDPCSLYSNNDECMNRVNEWCIVIDGVCRTANSCEEYTKDFLFMCDSIYGCAILNGMECLFVLIL
jgi:hypothetical protein